MEGNNPTAHDSDDPKRRTIILLLTGIIISGICMISAGVYFWMSSNQTSSLSQFFSHSTVTPPPTSIPTSTLVPTEDFSGIFNLTEEPMELAKEPPSFASAQEAQTALDQGADYLEAYAVEFPELPEINQPGDVYIYNLFLLSPEPLIWSYGWCTTTKAILDENFKHIQIDFITNHLVVPSENIAVFDDINSDGFPCRNYLVLIDEWTTGAHTFQTGVTFEQDINDGWNLYPAGTHTFEYFIPIFE